MIPRHLCESESYELPSSASLSESESWKIRASTSLIKANHAKYSIPHHSRKQMIQHFGGTLFAEANKKKHLLPTALYFVQQKHGDFSLWILTITKCFLLYAWILLGPFSYEITLRKFLTLTYIRLSNSEIFILSTCEVDFI